MGQIWLDVIIVFLLILANGFFSGAELAIISARKSRISQLSASGNSKALIVEKLQDDPHRFLATVQVGVTVVGSMASAVGGASAVEYLKPILRAAPFPIISDAAGPLSLALVVIVVSYLSLVLGELVPKTLALQYADRFSLVVAGPIDSLARIGGLFVTALTLSSKGVLALFGVRVEEKQAFITREEVQHIVAEGHESGVFSETEHEYIQNIFDFTHTAVREVMVPRTRIVGLDLDQPREHLVRVMMENMYSRYPVYRGSIESVLGFVHGKDFLGRMVTEPDFDLMRIVRPPFYVPEGKKVNDLLKEMQRLRMHMAMVVDEYGGISGLVTTEDLLEELVGEIEDEHDAGEPGPVQMLADGGYLVDALISLNDLEDLLEVKVEEDLHYDTLAGLILAKLGRFPEPGETLEWLGFDLTCEEVRKTAIEKVRITRKTVE